MAVELSLGITDQAVSSCKLEPPSSRTSLIHGFKEFPGDLERIADVLGERTLDADLRSALCLAVGAIGTDAAQATGLVLKKLYREASDPGTHSAARWALEQQGTNEGELALPQGFPESTTRDWYVNNKLNMALLKMPGGEFIMGSEDELTPHKVEVSEFFVAQVRF